jgi:hypothetical protein
MPMTRTSAGPELTVASRTRGRGIANREKVHTTGRSQYCFGAPNTEHRVATKPPSRAARSIVGSSQVNGSEGGVLAMGTTARQNPRGTKGRIGSARGPAVRSVAARGAAGQGPQKGRSRPRGSPAPSPKKGSRVAALAGPRSYGRNRRFHRGLSRTLQKPARNTLSPERAVLPNIEPPTSPRFGKPGLLPRGGHERGRDSGTPGVQPPLRRAAGRVGETAR